jgi:hypothetical protein
VTLFEEELEEELVVTLSLREVFGLGAAFKSSRAVALLRCGEALLAGLDWGDPLVLLGRSMGLPSGEAIERGGMGSLFTGLLLLLSSISVLMGMILLFVLGRLLIFEE